MRKILSKSLLIIGLFIGLILYTDCDIYAAPLDQVDAGEYLTNPQAKTEDYAYTGGKPHYYTHQWTVSRCINDPPTPYPIASGEYIWLEESEITRTDMENYLGIEGMTADETSITWEQLANYIETKGFSEWAEEVRKAINGEGSVWVKWDSVLSIYDALDTEVYTAWNYPSKFFAGEPDVEIAANYYGWADGGKGIRNHFDKYYYLGSAIPVEPELC